jgi:mono/diheme cytochrome c family protein
MGAALITATVVFQIERRPEFSEIARGRTLAVANGCFACHGTSDADSRVNRRQVSPGIWKSKSIPTFWDNGIDRRDVLVDWITHGVPKDEADAHRKLLIQMPAYEKFMTAPDIEAVAAWILSEGIRLSQSATENAASELPASEDAIRQLDRDHLLAVGDRLSRRHGCYQCHGEFGQGGIENPASFKGYIPGFFGADFMKLTNHADPAEILHWIDSGRGKEIESGALGSLAKKYLDHQAIGMPAYRDQLTTLEKTALVEYLLLLNQEGALSAKKLESLLQLLNEESSKKS